MLRLDARIYSISTISRGEYLKWSFWLVEKLGLWRYIVVYWLPGFASPYDYSRQIVFYFLLLISSLLLFLIFEQEWAQIKIDWLKTFLYWFLTLTSLLSWQVNMVHSWMKFSFFQKTLVQVYEPNIFFIIFWKMIYSKRLRLSVAVHSTSAEILIWQLCLSLFTLPWQPQNLCSFSQNSTFLI